MKQAIRLFLISSIIAMGLWLMGCTEESKTPVGPSIKSEIITVQPKGMISGKIFDRCTALAINGAVMSVGYDSIVHSTVSDASGSFAFANVPAGKYTVIDGRSVPTGTYLITASLVAYNAAQTDPTKRYRDYYYYPVTITFTSLVPGDSLGVSGLVGSVACSLSTLSTTVKGTVVNVDLQPVANATVRILEHTSGYVIAQQVTGLDGSYSVANIDNGLTIDVQAISSNGSIEGSVVGWSIPCNMQMDSLRAQVTLEQIVIRSVDDVNPFIISVSPENNSDVAAGTPIVYTFSEPIKQTAYTTNGAGYGSLVDNIHIINNSFKKVADEMQKPTIAWSANNTVLTVTPSGLVGSAKYTVLLDSTNVKANLTDAAGNTLRNNLSITGDLEPLNFTTTGSSAIPAAPALTRQMIPTVYGPLNYTGGTVSLEWNYDANVRSYNIYQSINNGSFDTIATDVRFTQFQATCPNLFTGSLNNPLASANVRYRITGVSKDLVEGLASNVITVTDAVRPQLTYFPAPAAVPGATNSWVYAIGFDEPMLQSTVETIGNYTFSNTGGVTYTVSSVTYAGYDGSQWIAYLQVTSSVVPVAGYLITTAATITDLAGNGIDAAANSHTY